MDNIIAIDSTMTMKPPLTMTIQTAAGIVWVHHVDAEGKPAGGVYNGVPYDTIDDLISRTNSAA